MGQASHVSVLGLVIVHGLAEDWFLFWAEADSPIFAADIALSMKTR